MKTYYQYLQILSMSCLLLGFKQSGNAQEQKFVVVQDQQEGSGSFSTHTTQLYLGSIDVIRKQTNKAKSPIILVAKLPELPPDGMWFAKP